MYAEPYYYVAERCDGSGLYAMILRNRTGEHVIANIDAESIDAAMLKSELILQERHPVANRCNPLDY